MQAVSIDSLFMWADFWALFSLGVVLFLGFLFGYFVGTRRAKKRAEDQHRERVLHLAVAHLLGEDILDE